MFAVEYDDGVDGPPRVWLGHMDVPGLAMSRSLCDGVAHTAGVSSEPEFNEYEFSLNREDIILVMASDGLWEFMSNQEVMDIVLHTTEPRFAVDRLKSDIYFLYISFVLSLCSSFHYIDEFCAPILDLSVKQTIDGCGKNKLLMTQQFVWHF